MTETFRAFCAEQLGRLHIFQDWRQMDAAGKKEYRRWLEAHTADEAKVRGLIDEILTRDALPTLAAVTRIWMDLNPPDRFRGCPLCGGTGFEIVEQGLYTGARRCRCRTAAVA